MKSSLLAGLSAALLLCCGCQSTRWTAKNKKDTTPAVAQNKPVREIPWSEWGKKKEKTDQNTQLPAELQAKLDKANGKGDLSKTAAEWVAEGNQLEVGRNFAAATEAYEAALQVDPVHADAHHRLGIMADMRQEYGTARDHYEAALRQKSHDANLLSDFGYSMHLQGNRQQSERYLLQSLDADPQHKQALKNLVTLYASQDRYDDAAQICRRLRPEAEAQRLLDQGFPKGRGQPAANEVEFAANQNPRDNRLSAPPRDVAEPALKNKSVEEMYQLMAKERQAGIQARQEKTLKEFRPELQDSLTQHAWDESQPPNIAPKTSPQVWAQNSPADEPQPIIRPARSPSAAQQHKAEELAANNRPFPDDVTLWNGAPVNRQTAPEAPRNDQQAPSWAADELDKSRAVGADQGLAATDGRPHVPPQTRLNAASSAPVDNLVAQSSANLRAYQLGMSAGPGTMFPTLPVDTTGRWHTDRTVVPPAGESQPPNVGTFLRATEPPQRSTDAAPRGYSDTRATNLIDQAGNEANLERGPFAPVEVAPRSPTENWESPATMPWPDRAAMKPQPEIPMRRSESPPANRLPPGSRNTSVHEYENTPASYQSGANREAPRRPEVVPAWFDAPRSDRSDASDARNVNTIPRWPYAPQ